MRVGSVVGQRFFPDQPPMTVERLFANECNRPPTLHADCVWFDAENKLRRAAFGTRELEEVMHYKDGTEAKLFDTVKGLLYGPNADGKWDTRERDGVLIATTPGCTTCNGTVLVGAPKNLGGVSLKVERADNVIEYVSGQIIGGYFSSATLGELELVERVKKANEPVDMSRRLPFEPVGRGG